MSERNGTAVKDRKAAEPGGLMDLIERATEDDLAKLDEQIGDLQKQMDRLAAVRRMIGVLLHGKPARGKRGKKPASNPAVTPMGGATANPATAEKRRRIAKLLGTDGPLMPHMIADRLGLPPQGIHGTLGCDWFEQTSMGVRLTATGRREALGEKVAAI